MDCHWISKKLRFLIWRMNIALCSSVWEGSEATRGRHLRQYFLVHRTPCVIRSPSSLSTQHLLHHVPKHPSLMSCLCGSKLGHGLSSPRRNDFPEDELEANFFSSILVVNLFICFAKAKGILRWLRRSHSLLNHTTKWSENEALIHVAGDITGEVVSSGQKQSHKNAPICQCLCVRAYTTGQEFPALPFFLWNFSIACNGSRCFLLRPGCYQLHSDIPSSVVWSALWPSWMGVPSFQWLECAPVSRRFIGFTSYFLTHRSVGGGYAFQTLISSLNL